MARLPCELIRRRLEEYAGHVELAQIGHAEEPGAFNPSARDCVFDIHPSFEGEMIEDITASVQLALSKTGRPRVREADVPVYEYNHDAVFNLLTRKATSCKLKQVHKHYVDPDGMVYAENEPESRDFPNRFDFHLTSCTVPDFGEVLKTAGYKE